MWKSEGIGGMVAVILLCPFRYFFLIRFYSEYTFFFFLVAFSFTYECVLVSCIYVQFVCYHT